MPGRTDRTVFDPPVCDQLGPRLWCVLLGWMYLTVHFVHILHILQRTQSFWFNCWQHPVFWILLRTQNPAYSLKNGWTQMHAYLWCRCWMWHSQVGPEACWLSVSGIKTCAGFQKAVTQSPHREPPTPKTELKLCNNHRVLCVPGVPDPVLTGQETPLSGDLNTPRAELGRNWGFPVQSRIFCNCSDNLSQQGEILRHGLAFFFFFF